MGYKEKICSFPPKSQNLKFFMDIFACPQRRFSGNYEGGGGGGILFRWRYEESSLMVVAVPVGAAVQD